MIILSSFGLGSSIISKQFKEHIPCPQDKRVLLIPFAGLNPLFSGRFEYEGLINFGFQKSNIFVLTENNADEARNLSFDYIYVSGGDTFKLLSKLQKINFLNDIVRMVKAGTAYIGVSAGAMLTAGNIEYVEKLEDNNYDLDNYDGLGFTDDFIICHIDLYGLSAVTACKSVCRGRRLLGIRNNEIYIIEEVER